MKSCNALIAVLVVVPTWLGCALNPATGESQLSLISESQEVQMGRQAAQQVAHTIGLVENRALQTYVQRVGRALAATSQRPELPWDFHVVDDPAPNAFAGHTRNRRIRTAARSRVPDRRLWRCSNLRLRIEHDLGVSRQLS